MAKARSKNTSTKSEPTRSQEPLGQIQDAAEGLADLFGPGSNDKKVPFEATAPSGSHVDKEPKRALEHPARCLLGVLDVNCLTTPTYKSVPTFEYLSNGEASATASRQTGRPVMEAPATHELNSTTSASATQHHTKAAAAQSRNAGLRTRKRAHSGAAFYKREDDGDDDYRVTALRRETFLVSDVEQLKRFIKIRCEEMKTQFLRKILTGWVKLLWPDRERKYGRYHRNLPSARRPDEQPPAWPPLIPYKEPAHLAKEYLIPMAIDMMQMHRKVDEESGKRGAKDANGRPRGRAWISELRKNAMTTLDSSPANRLSADKIPEECELKKSRVMDQILPSLFDIAQSYEDYFERYQLYEGYGNTDPGHAKQVSWSRIESTPRPSYKRRKRPSNAQSSSTRSQRDSVSTDSGSETKCYDNQQISPIGSFSSCGSNNSVERGPMATLPNSVASVPSSADASLTTVGLDPADHQPEVPFCDPFITPASTFDESMSRLNLADGHSSASIVSSRLALTGFPLTSLSQQIQGGLPFSPSVSRRVAVPMTTDVSSGVFPSQWQVPCSLPTAAGSPAYPTLQPADPRHAQVHMVVKPCPNCLCPNCVSQRPPSGASPFSAGVPPHGNFSGAQVHF